MCTTCENCGYWYECEGTCKLQEVNLPEEEDWVPEISTEDYAEWSGKGWLYE